MTDRIYYADKELINRIRTEFELVEEKGWYELYKNLSDKTFWRLDKWDKYQEQFFVRVDNVENWEEFDDKELRVQLLLKTRGTTDSKCIWNGCNNKTLIGLVYCERHAYEFGIRR